ncbi:MAG: hypothetical protein Q4B65_00525 [Candidatus Saccharibacteria bacterium]|nr:hypothetical protein [Candidatus Saccharibacteria bacterium]
MGAQENEKSEAFYSWPIVILALCLFWPLGIFLIIRKVSKDKKSLWIASKIISCLSIVSYFFAAVGLLSSFGSSHFMVDNSSHFMVGPIAISLFFGAAGFALGKVAKKMKVESENVKQYLSVIVNGRVRQLDTIASTTGKPYEVVYKDVKKMINKGYLKNAYIDENARKIVLPTSGRHDGSDATAQTKKLVTCPYCGANNTVYGDAGECEYCGSPLK